MLVLPVAVLAAGAVLASPDDAARRAAVLDREAAELSALLTAEDERFAEESAGEAASAASLSDHLPADPKARAAVERALARADAHRKATRPLRYHVALLAEQLQRYRETGDLSPTSPAAAARLRRLLDSPWDHREPPVEPLSQDLLVMQKQLGKWDAGAPALVARRTQPAPRTAGEPARAGSGGRPPVAVARRAAAPPALMADAGTGRAKTDPVPALLAQLEGGEPRLRALAAEELGQLRDGRAVEPLRRALGDRSPRVRASAALALGQIGDASRLVIADLQKALGDPYEEVRVDTRTALSLLVRR